MDEPTETLNTSCMECGEDCDNWAVHKPYWGSAYEEIWCYCPKCDVETFHDLPGQKDPYM